MNSLKKQVLRMKREDPDNMPDSSSLTNTPRKPKAEGAVAGDGNGAECGSHEVSAEAEGKPAKKAARAKGGKRKNVSEDANGEGAGGENAEATPTKAPKRPRKAPAKKTVKQEEVEGGLV